jgi:hypothetical protein
LNTHKKDVIHQIRNWTCSNGYLAKDSFSFAFSFAFTKGKNLSEEEPDRRTSTSPEGKKEHEAFNDAFDEARF